MKTGVNRKRSMEAILLLFLPMLLFLLFPGKAEASSGISLTRTSLVLREGRSAKLGLENVEKKKWAEIRWKSSDRKVASISGGPGRTITVTGLRSGIAAVYASFGAETCLCTVQVGDGERVSSSTREILGITGTEDDFAAYRIDESVPSIRALQTGKRVLIVCGHGQGDPGAVSSWGQEQNYTREFGKLILWALRRSGAVKADLYNRKYNLYEQMRSTLSSGLRSSVRGNGKLKGRVLSALRQNSHIPDLTRYSYILEIHFNAKAVKTIHRDGRFYGIGAYVNSAKGNTQVESRIVRTIGSHGFKQWGIFRSSGLLNARICQELGVNYALLETAFLDDGDDMTYYNANKILMAQLTANAIVDYLAG